jgi:lysophospholipase L1-like esterase
MHQMHVNQTKMNAKNNTISVIFYGDSITQLWASNDAKSIWNKRYAPFGAVNYGIGGDKTQNVLWRIENGNIEILTSPPPKVVVLCIGTNNIGVKDVTNEDIARGVKKIVSTLRQKLPNTKVLIVGLFPRQVAWTFTQVSDVNLRISKIDPKYALSDLMDSTNGTRPEPKKGAENQMVNFLDMWTHFALNFGEVVPELFLQDKLHLSAKGYAKWAQVMEPVLKEMMHHKGQN